jgi:transposase
MAEDYDLIHERVDDVPLIIGLAQRLRLPDIIDKYVGNHGHHHGLSNGWLATIWLAYILSEGDHRKYSVEDWANKHNHTLEQLVGQPIRQVEFSDDRLGIVLRRLSPADTWESLESDLWSSTVAVYEIQVTGVRLDSTTTYGYHNTTESEATGVMQHGYSKDHRPDLPQLKLMAAGAEPSGHLMASDVLPGDKADDPLYLPMVDRVRRMVGKSGLLYTGDSKMSALETRADIAVHKDYYLTPLPLKGKAKEHIAAWVNAIVDGNIDGQQCAQLIWDQERLLGGGYEFERSLSAETKATEAKAKATQRVEWTERVQVIRSLSIAKHEGEKLEQRLSKAKAELLSLTPEPGRGKHQYRDKASFQSAVTKILERHRVTGLLHITYEREEQRITHYVGRGRGGPNRPKKTEVQVRYVITGVQPNHLAIENHKHRLGWRVYGTNLPVERMSLAQSVIHYRGGWSLERDFHLVKDRPLGIRPLYVRRDDQIAGLTHLLTLALRLLTLIEIQVRHSLAQTGEEMTGLYAGQPNRKTTRPTGVSLLKAFARGEVTLTRIQMGEQHSWHITPLSSLQMQILAYLKLSPSLYKRLIENSS